MTKADLRFKVREMELLAVVQEKRYDQYKDHLEAMYKLQREQAINDLRGALISEKRELELTNQSLQAKVEQLEKRVAESPYKQLEEILKALVVKLPTLNVSSLNVETKGK